MPVFRCTRRPYPNIPRVRTSAVHSQANLSFGTTGVLDTAVAARESGIPAGVIADHIRALAEFGEVIVEQGQPEASPPPFVCALCGREFRSLAGVKRHLRRAHPEA